MYMYNFDHNCKNEWCLLHVILCVLCSQWREWCRKDGEYKVHPELPVGNESQGAEFSPQQVSGGGYPGEQVCDIWNWDVVSVWDRLWIHSRYMYCNYSLHTGLHVMWWMPTIILFLIYIVDQWQLVQCTSRMKPVLCGAAEPLPV